MTFEGMRAALFGPVATMISDLNQYSGLSVVLFLIIAAAVVVGLISWIRSGQ